MTNFFVGGWFGQRFASQALKPLNFHDAIPCAEEGPAGAFRKTLSIGHHVVLDPYVLATHSLT